jgi:PhnB protein
MDGVVQRITPYLLYSDVGAAIEYLNRVFGFRETLRFAGPDGRVSHAEVVFSEGGEVMLGDPGDGYRTPAELGGVTQMVHVYVDDVDAHYEAARRAGAVIERELADQPYGDRSYSAVDLGGHQWFFATRLKDVAPEEWGAVAAPGDGPS